MPGVGVGHRASMALEIAVYSSSEDIVPTGTGFLAACTVTDGPESDVVKVDEGWIVTMAPGFPDAHFLTGKPAA